MGKNKDVDKGSKGKGKKIIREHKATVVIGVVLCTGVIFLLALLDFYFDIFDLTEKITLVQIVSFFGAIITLALFFKRLKNQEKQLEKQEEQIALQIKQRLDDRFTTAVNLLGNDQTSARTGAIYSLYQLAIDEEKYRSQIAQILCSHIRSHTSAPEYQERHKDRPSNEIQTTINLLVREVHNTKGLYCQGFEAGLPRLDFNHAYLVNADFSGAWCQGADFSHTRCHRVRFYDAQCQGADFKRAHCQRVRFTRAWCQGVNFRKAWCQGAYFGDAQCQGAVFTRAWCQGAYFRGAQCQGAHFNFAQCQGTDFSGAQCQGACATGGFPSVKGRIYKPKLKDQIGKPTELKNMIIAGQLSGDDLQSIEAAKEYCSEDWYKSMQGIIAENKGKEEKQGEPEGIVKGILEDSPELQAVIKELEAIEKSGK